MTAPDCRCYGAFGSARVRGALACDACREAWIAGYASAIEDAMAGRMPDDDAGASAHDIAQEMASHAE